ELLEQFRRNSASLLGVRKSNKHGIVAGGACLHLSPISEPGIKPFSPFQRRHTLIVAEVVGMAHESIHSGERVAFGQRQRQKRVVKVARFTPCDAKTHRIRGSKLRLAHNRLHKDRAAALATRASFRVLEIAGREHSTSLFWRAMELRIFSTPPLKES